MTLPTAVAAALLGLALVYSPAAGAGCPPTCATASSVVNAAGVPTKLARAAAQLQFRGDTLSPAAAGAVKTLAAEIKRLPASARVTLRVGADGSLTGAAASSQVSARQRAVQQALEQQGVRAAQLLLEALP